MGKTISSVPLHQIGEYLLGSVNFHKYYLLGNSFVLVDETQGEQLDETQKSLFAAIALNEYCGIGADNLIFIQPYTKQVMREINAYRHYWAVGLEGEFESDADYIFRMFEPDGQEAFCCGNGLLSSCHHLHGRYGILEARVMSQIPTASPASYFAQVLAPGRSCRINMGRPSALPDSFMSGKLNTCPWNLSRVMRNLSVPLEERTLEGYSQSYLATVDGYLIYSGEPHLVIFHGDGLCSPDDIFPDESHHAQSKAPASAIVLDKDTIAKLILDSTNGPQYHLLQRHSLLHKLGMRLNSPDDSYFPYGVNVSFARIIDADLGIVEYRCFERGIKKETHACGTGAVAVAAVAHQLGFSKSTSFAMWPQSSRRHEPQAWQKVSRDLSGDWWLEGEPRLLFSGVVEFPKPLQHCAD